MRIQRSHVPNARIFRKIYKCALLHELNLAGLNCETERHLKVLYKDVVVGDFYADIIVDNRVILELKAVDTLHPSHEVQLVNYLTATGIDDGLLINFGSNKIQIKRKFRIYKPKQT